MTESRRKTRKRYEDYGVARSEIEKRPFQAVSWGPIDSPLNKAELVKEACEKMCFSIAPKDGWEYVAQELYIIDFQIPQRPMENSLSRAKMAKAYSTYADQLSVMAERMNEISQQEDFLIAAFEAKSWQDHGDKVEYANLHNRVIELVAPMRKFTKWLEMTGEAQSHKFRCAIERERRLVLACKLAPVFKCQFGFEPKLKGGSASRAIEEENPWAQFFQAAASLVFGEQVTADRQGILLEARLPTE